jgi:hypothetical protein
MSKSYYCPCSKCLGSKLVVKRTLEVHFRRDQDFLDTLHPDTISATFVRSCVDNTTKLLTRINEAYGLPDLASDPIGSRPEGSEGALLGIIS